MLLCPNFYMLHAHTLRRTLRLAVEAQPGCATFTSDLASAKPRASERFCFHLVSTQLGSAYCITRKLVPFFIVKLSQRSAVMRGHVKLPCDEHGGDDCNHDACEDGAHDAYHGVPSSSVL